METGIIQIKDNWLKSCGPAQCYSFKIIFFSGLNSTEDTNKLVI